MVTLHPQYVTDQAGHCTAVLLPADEYARLIEELEMTDDIAAYQRAKAEGGGSVPYDQVRQELGLSG